MTMLEKLKRLFGALSEAETPGEKNSENDLNVAVCALFLEMGRIDESFTNEELAKVLSILQQKYGLSKEDADTLMGEADRELEESVDLWQFARVINDHYTPADKEKLVRRLWRVVYVDGKMDRHEHYLMNKVSKLLRLSHKQLIDAKLQVLHEK